MALFELSAIVFRLPLAFNVRQGVYLFLRGTVLMKLRNAVAFALHTNPELCIANLTASQPAYKAFVVFDSLEQLDRTV